MKEKDYGCSWVERQRSNGMHSRLGLIVVVEHIEVSLWEALSTGGIVVYSKSGWIGSDPPQTGFGKNIGTIQGYS